MRNALQTILGAIGGGLEGQAAQRAYEDEQRRMERDRLDRLAREAAASERQTALDQVALLEQGYVEQGERAQNVRRASPALTDALQNAGAAMTGQAPRKAVDMNAIMGAAGQYGAPVSSVNVGGKTFERTQTPQQERQMVAAQDDARQRAQRMEAATEAARLRSEELNANVQTIKAGLGGKVNDAQAMMIARGLAKKEDFITPDMSPAEKARFSLEWARLGLDRDKFNFEKNQPQPGTGGQAGTAAQDTFPGVTEAVTFFKSLTPEQIKNIRSTGANAASVAQATSGTWSGLLGGMVANPLTTPEERAYAESSRAVANAVARLREKGVLSNQDITRFESQISGVAGQSPQDMQRKIARATAWAEWLASPESSVPASQRTPSMRQPGETAAEYAARTNRGPF